MNFKNCPSRPIPCTTLAPPRVQRIKIPLKQTIIATRCDRYHQRTRDGDTHRIARQARAPNQANRHVEFGHRRRTAQCERGIHCGYIGYIDYIQLGVIAHRLNSFFETGHQRSKICLFPCFFSSSFARPHPVLPHRDTTQHGCVRACVRARDVARENPQGNDGGRISLGESAGRPRRKTSTGHILFIPSFFLPSLQPSVAHKEKRENDCHRPMTPRMKKAPNY